MGTGIIEERAPRILAAFASVAAVQVRSKTPLRNMALCGNRPRMHSSALAGSDGRERPAPVEQPQTISTDFMSSRERNAALRVRQHVNPLAHFFQRPVRTDGWMEAAFENPALPLVVDVGCAKGRWLRKMAEADKSRNFVGLEIRAELVAAANGVRDRDQVGNLHYMYCNANVSFNDIVSAAEKQVCMVCFQFCDPWFKARHAKRRVVQEPIVEQVAQSLKATNGLCFVVSDVLALAEEMRSRFDDCPGMVRDDSFEWSEDGWLVDNPFGVKTEREITVLRKPGLAVYGAMFRSEKTPPPS